MKISIDESERTIMRTCGCRAARATVNSGATGSAVGIHSDGNLSDEVSSHLSKLLTQSRIVGQKMVSPKEDSLAFIEVRSDKTPVPSYDQTPRLSSRCLIPERKELIASHGKSWPPGQNAFPGPEQQGIQIDVSYMALDQSRRVQRTAKDTDNNILGRQGNATPNL